VTWSYAGRSGWRQRARRQSSSACLLGETILELIVITGCVSRVAGRLRSKPRQQSTMSTRTQLGGSNPSWAMRVVSNS
jgi:hypothetical protein